MTNKIEVARNVAAHLLATEESIDAAIKCAASLVGYMPDARQQAHVSAAVGQPAFEHVIATMSMLGEARRRIVEAHQALAESGRQARIPIRDFGGFIDKTSDKAQSGLHVVSGAGVA